MLNVLKEAFNMSRGGSNDVGTGLDGTTDHMERGYFDRNFSFTFASLKCDDHCYAETTAFYLLLN